MMAWYQCICDYRIHSKALDRWHIPLISTFAASGPGIALLWNECACSVARWNNWVMGLCLWIKKTALPICSYCTECLPQRSRGLTSESSLPTQRIIWYDDKLPTPKPNRQKEIKCISRWTKLHTNYIIQIRIVVMKSHLVQ